MMDCTWEGVNLVSRMAGVLFTDRGNLKRGSNLGEKSKVLDMLSLGYL